MPLLQRPAHLAGRNGQTMFDKMMGGLGLTQPPRISLKDDRFTLIYESGMIAAPAQLELHLVIVGANPQSSRVLYPDYDPADPEPPLCWSDNGVGPSVGAQAPQHPTCSGCPKAEWGSATSEVTGKPIPACSTVKKIAVLAPPLEGVFLMQIPPASLANWKRYMAELAKMGASPEEIVTHVKMESKQLLFDAIDWVPEGYMSKVEEAINSDQPDAVCNVLDKAIEHMPRLAAPATLGPDYAKSIPPQLVAAAMEGPPPNQFSPPQQDSAPRPRGRPPKVKPNETLVPPGPIAPQTFAPQPPAPPSFGGFGIKQPESAPSSTEALLSRAFGLPTGR